jgi:hypothetical protein
MSASALVRGALLGWWKITSFHVELEDTGECVDTYGVDPLGHMVITDDRNDVDPHIQRAHRQRRRSALRNDDGLLWLVPYRG